jgi:NADH dehydrogenase [ubiquinone] 1 alpha subcomplex assembly factor 7
VSTLALQRFGPQPDVSIDPAFLARRAELVESCEAVEFIASPRSQEAAVAILRDVAATLKSIEAARQEIKGPVLDLGRRIDAAAKEAVAPLVAHESRIKGLLSSYQAEERRKAAEAEAARQAELRRQAEERAKAEAEARRKAEAEAAELRRRNEEALAKAKSEEERAAAERRAAQEARDAQARAEAERRRLEEEAKRAAAAAAKPITAPRAAGMMTREVWVFEVTDLNALIAHDNDVPEGCRGFVRYEPNTANINAAIRNGMRECPGLRIYQQTKAGVRV